MTTFRKGAVDWTQYRRLESLVEVDFHDTQRGTREVPYWEAMASVTTRAIAALRNAQE